MTVSRSLLPAIAVSAVFALGACEKQPVSTIESIEKTLHHEIHEPHGGGDHGHGTKGHDTKDAEKTAKEGAAQPAH